MFLKKIDFLSPQITLYHKGLLYHSSLISGILSILICILVIIFSSLYLVKLWHREREDPKMSSYSGFIEDAGIFNINSSELFHFLSLNLNKTNNYDSGFDFQAFKVIGLDTYFERYKSNENLNNFNHWLYGPCNNETDAKGINHLITQEYFTKSACIKKYFNSTEQKYYNISEEGFKWPVIAHGTFNPNKKLYNIFVEKCEQKILDEINDKGYKCKNNSEIEELLKYAIIHLNFIDEYVDIKKYKEPIRKYFYRIENKLDKDNFSINHLNFIPSLIKTNDGIIKDNIKEEYSYSYIRNDVFVYTYYQNIYIVYYFWLNNRINYFERTYESFQDKIANIGGIYEVLMTICLIINKIFNDYAMLSDTEQLLSSDSSSRFSLKENIKKKKIMLDILKQKKFQSEKELKSIKQIDNKIEKNICTNSTEQAMHSNKNISSSKNKNNCSFILEKAYNYENSDIINNKDFNNNNNNIQYYENNKITFWRYILYKISCGKLNSNLKLYEAFRIKLISVENIINNHLNLVNLLKLLEINQID